MSDGHGHKDCLNGGRRMKRPQSIRVLRKAALGMGLLLIFGTSTWVQPVADPSDGNESAGQTAEPSTAQPPACFDPTPHEVTFVTVEPGVQLEVLDFGGSGEAMVLLAGLGHNAHAWDDVAYQFTDYFRVIGITRR